MPPQTSSIRVRSVMPIGTSTRPIVLSGPWTVISFVPELFSVPMLAYQAPPLLMMSRTFAIVSVLFATVGRFQRPSPTDRGGLVRGWPRTPLTEYIRAEPSPQMYAPPPVRPRKATLLPEPSTFLPIRPRRSASATAFRNRLIAHG